MRGVTGRTRLGLFGAPRLSLPEALEPWDTPGKSVPEALQHLQRVPVSLWPSRRASSREWPRDVLLGADELARGSQVVDVLR